MRESVRVVKEQLVELHVLHSLEKEKPEVDSRACHQTHLLRKLITQESLLQSSSKGSIYLYRPHLYQCGPCSNGTDLTNHPILLVSAGERVFKVNSTINPPKVVEQIMPSLCVHPRLVILPDISYY